MRPLLPHITGRRPAIGPPAGLVGVEVVEGNPQGLPDCGGRHAPASLLAGDPVAEGAELAGSAHHTGEVQTSEEGAGAVGNDEGVRAARCAVRVRLLQDFPLALRSEPGLRPGRLPRDEVLPLGDDQRREGGGVVGRGGAESGGHVSRPG